MVDVVARAEFHGGDFEGAKVLEHVLLVEASRYLFVGREKHTQGGGGTWADTYC